MIKHYLKASFASLWKRKWFSLLTLFSIAISLVVVISMASFWNMLTAPIKPISQKERIVYLEKEIRRKDNGELTTVYEAPEIITKDFYTKTINGVEGVDAISFFEWGKANTDLILNGRGKSFAFKHTDANFFKIFDFDFIDGGPYREEEISAKQKVIVISEKIANFFFGSPYCAKKELVMFNSNYKIAGVYKEPAYTTPIKSDFYVGAWEKELFPVVMSSSDFEVAFLIAKGKNKHELEQQLESIGKKISEGNEKYELELFARSSFEKTLSGRYNLTSKPAYSVLIFLMLILPMFSLYELLKSNLQMRLEEIGTRKAFGAKNKVIVKQLLLENVLITILGGILGTGFSLLFFKVLSGNSISNLYASFFHWRALFYFLAVFIFFGVFAGLLPSLVIARLKVVDILNQSTLDFYQRKGIFNRLRKYLISGTILIISFFIITISVSEVFVFLSSSVKTRFPINTENIIVAEISYTRVRGDNFNLKSVQSEVKSGIEKIDGVEVSSFSEFSVDGNVFSYWDLRNDECWGILCGADYGRVFDFKLISGRWFDNSDLEKTQLPVVLTKSHAKNLGLTAISKNTVFHFKSDRYDETYQVVGIIEDMGSLQSTTEKPVFPFFAPVEVSKKNSISGDYRIIKIKDGKNAEVVVKQIDALYESEGWNKKMFQFQVSTLKSIMKDKLIKHLYSYAMEYGIIVMVALLIAIILFGRFWRQVYTRVHEIGIRRSVGANKWRILRMIFIEKLTFFAIVLTLSMIVYLNFYKVLRINSMVVAPLISASLIFIMVMIATLIPAFRAANIKPVEALAEE